jgi:hypothetical protein
MKREGAKYINFFLMLKTTVKAPNFGPHGNIEHLFQEGLLSLKRVLQKNKENKSCRKTLDLQVWFCSFFVHDSSTEATELARKSPKFPRGPKLGAFTVIRFHNLCVPRGTF